MVEIESAKHIERRGILAYDQFLTLYFPTFVFALGYSIATPAIPVFAKSFDTGFAVASLVIVMHALGGLISAVPSVFLIDYIGRLVSPALFGFVADQASYSAAYIMTVLFALATAALLTFSVKETVGTERR